MAALNQEADKNPNWRGGRSISSGYVRVRAEGHPKATKLGFYVFEHVLVMEKSLGRYLKKGEVVHHKNRKRNDNRLENLELTSHSEHCGHHNSERIATPEYRKKRSLISKSLKRVKGMFVGKKAQLEDSFWLLPLTALLAVFLIFFLPPILRMARWVWKEYVHFYNRVMGGKKDGEGETNGGTAQAGFFDG